MLTARDLEKQTRPKKNGAADGKRDFPGPDAAAYASDTEQEIVSLCQDEVTRETGRFNQVVEAARARIAAVRSTIPGNIAAEAETIKANLKGIVDRHAAGIRDAADEAERRRKDFRHFRVLNDLTYEPDYSDSIINLIGFVAIIATAEAAMNAYFFGEASDRGLAGGFFTAGMISLVNVGAGFLVGMLLCRQFHHVQKWRLVFAVPLVAITVTCGFVFNLIVGHYREALIKDPDALILEIVPGAIGQLFDIRSMPSIILVLVGSAIFLLSIIKGYRVFDTYPGYMGKHRKMKLAEEKLEEEREAAKNDVEDELGEAIGTFESKGAILNAARSSLDRVEQEIAASLAGLNINIEQIEQVGNTAMKLYRSANLEVRNPRVAAPKYFQSDFRLERVTLTAQLTGAKEELLNARQQVADADKLFHEAHGALTRERVEIMEQLNDTVASAEVQAKARAEAARLAEDAAREALRPARA